MSSTAAPLTPLQQRKRSLILDGARTVLLRDGFSAASMDDVAAAAGVGKQTVYRHFGSKEALVTALVETMCSGWRIDEAPAAAAGTDAELAEALRAFGAQFVQGLVSPESLALYRAIVGEAARQPALGRLFYAAGPRRARRAVASLLAARATSAEAERCASLFVQVALGDAYLEMTLGMEPTALANRFGAQIEFAIAATLEMVRAAAARR